MASSIQRPVYVVYNPQAGQLRRRPAQLTRTLALLRQKWPGVRAIPTDGPKTAGRLVGSLVDEGAGLILIAGGDGTVNEALPGIAGSDVPIGILPFGTANVLANELRLGNDALRTARQLMECTPVPVALGRMSSDYGTRLFICMAGAGLDARVTSLVNPALKRRIGKLSYYFHSFQQVGSRLPEFLVRAEGREYRTSFALISRVRNYGGDFEIARRANLLEDRFAVVLFSGESSFRYVAYFLGVITHTHEQLHGVTMIETASVQVEPLEGQPLDLHVDGEYAGAGAAHFQIAGSQVRLLTPAPYVSVMTPATVRLQYESS